METETTALHTIRSLERRYRYKSHPCVVYPLLEPEGWADLRPLLCARLHLELTEGDIAPGLGPIPFIAEREQGLVDRIEPRFIEQYRWNLARCLARLMASGSRRRDQDHLQRYLGNLIPRVPQFAREWTGLPR